MNETSPPENGTVQVSPEQPPAPPKQPPVYAYPEPVPPDKPKTNVPMFLVGLVTPIAIGLLLIWLANALDPQTVFSGLAFPGLFSLLFVVFLVLFLKSRQSGESKLRSFAKGAMWAYITVPLFLLVAFGTCLIGINGLG